MSYHLAGSLSGVGMYGVGGLGDDVRKAAFDAAKNAAIARGTVPRARHTQVYRGNTTYFGGLGSTAKKEALVLSKAIALNALTPAEVAKVNSVWLTYNANITTLTTGKKKITIDAAIKLLGPTPSIEQIVGHPLVAGAAGGGGVPGALPGLSPPPGTGGDSTTDAGDGPPWGLIAGGVALLAVGYVVTQR